MRKMKTKQNEKERKTPDGCRRLSHISTDSLLVTSSVCLNSWLEARQENVTLLNKATLYSQNGVKRKVILQLNHITKQTIKILSSIKNKKKDLENY